MKNYLNVISDTRIVHRNDLTKKRDLSNTTINLFFNRKYLIGSESSYSIEIFNFELTTENSINDGETKFMIN